MTPTETIATFLRVDPILSAQECEDDATALVADLKVHGFVIVPKEPTEKMYAAAEREWDGRMSARSRGVWQAMLNAAAL